MYKLLQAFLPFRRWLWLAALCNVLMSLFMLISIPVLQIFLGILFKSNSPSILNTGNSLGNQIQSFIRGFFTRLIEQFGESQALLIVIAMLIGSFLGKNLFRYLSLFFLAPVRTGIVRNYRHRLMEKVLGLPLSYFSNERKGDLMSRFTSDVNEIEWSIVGMIEAVVREPLVIIGSIIYMFILSPELVGFVFILLAFTGIIIGGLGRRLRRRSGEAQSRLGGVVSLIEETLGGLRIIKGFNAEGYQTRRFSAENSAYADTVKQVLRWRDSASPVSEFFGITTMAIFIWYGARQVLADQMAADSFMTFLFALYSVIDPAKAISQALYNIRKGQGALERVQALLDADIAIHEPENAKNIAEFKDRVSFQKVTFQYSGAERPAVDDISLEIPKGKIIALVGASGAGKSTVADLLPRFYDVTNGAILIDGLDIREVKIRDLRNQLGIVSQEAVLFNDSVKNNILFGNASATQADVEAAAKAANAHEFILALPQGYETNIGDRGTKLSGGQRQRLTIARALLKNPPILILDEATSALDSESERLVQAALDRLLQNRTALVIAHRLSTVQHADEIIVMDAGRIVERGSHAELMKNGRIYRKLVELQAL